MSNTNNNFSRFFIISDIEGNLSYFYNLIKTIYIKTSTNNLDIYYDYSIDNIIDSIIHDPDVLKIFADDKTNFITKNNLLFDLLNNPKFKYHNLIFDNSNDHSIIHKFNTINFNHFYYFFLGDFFDDFHKFPNHDVFLGPSDIIYTNKYEYKSINKIYPDDPKVVIPSPDVPSVSTAPSISPAPSVSPDILSESSPELPETFNSVSNNINHKSKIVNLTVLEQNPDTFETTFVDRPFSVKKGSISILEVNKNLKFDTRLQINTIKQIVNNFLIYFVISNVFNTNSCFIAGNHEINGYDNFHKSIQNFLTNHSIPCAFLLDKSNKSLIFLTHFYFFRYKNILLNCLKIYSNAYSIDNPEFFDDISDSATRTEEYINDVINILHIPTFDEPVDLNNIMTLYKFKYTFYDDVIDIGYFDEREYGGDAETNDSFYCFDILSRFYSKFPLLHIDDSYNFFCIHGHSLGVINQYAWLKNFTTVSVDYSNVYMSYKYAYLFNGKVRQSYNSYANFCSSFLSVIRDNIFKAEIDVFHNIIPNFYKFSYLNSKRKNDYYTPQTTCFNNYIYCAKFAYILSYVFHYFKKHDFISCYASDLLNNCDINMLVYNLILHFINTKQIKLLNFSDDNTKDFSYIESTDTSDHDYINSKTNEFVLKINNFVCCSYFSDLSVSVDTIISTLSSNYINPKLVFNKNIFTNIINFLVKSFYNIREKTSANIIFNPNTNKYINAIDGTIIDYSIPKQILPYNHLINVFSNFVLCFLYNYNNNIFSSMINFTTYIFHIFCLNHTTDRETSGKHNLSSCPSFNFLKSYITDTKKFTINTFIFSWNNDYIASISNDNYIEYVKYLKYKAKFKSIDTNKSSKPSKPKLTIIRKK